MKHLLLFTALPLIAQQPGTVPQLSPPAPAPAIPAPPFPAAAAEDKIEAQLNPSTLNTGEEGMLYLRIPNGLRMEKFPQVIDAPGLSIQFGGSSSSAYNNNGRIGRRMELQYRVEAVDSGTHTIPALSLTVDGRVLKTDPIEVVVKEGQPLDEALMPQAQLTVGKTEIWEGEEVPINVNVLLHGGIQVTSQPFPVIKSDGVAVSRFDRHGQTEATQVNGDYWTTWHLPSSLTPIKTGDIVFGPAEVKLDVLMSLRNGQRDPFGGFPSSRRTLKVNSNTVKLRVKPLPAAGKPAEFNGLVGNFQITARSDSQSTGPQQVELGDPLGFEITITGTGNFDAVNPPALENPENFRTFKPKVSAQNRGFGQEIEQKVFTQIVFAQKPGLNTIVFTLPHFEPASGKYVTAKSAPVELIVTGEVKTAAAEAAVTGAETRDFAGAVKATVPGEELQDILPNAVEGGRWYSTVATLVPVHPWLLHGAPALLLAVLLGTGTNRRLRAWALSRRPPADAPRPCDAVARDLRRDGLSRLQFYSLVSEYAHAWEYWKKSPPPADDKLAAVLAARDHWLYATNAEPAAAPVPRDEQSQAASILTARLSA